MAINKKNIIKLDKKDHLRALLTDTAPSDVPVMFSNDGLYINAHRAKKDKDSDLGKLTALLYTHTIEPKDDSKRLSQSTPLKYRITKNDVSLRTLSLSHPRAQKNFVNFYQEYSAIITYLCSMSPFSIRAPEKVGNSIFSYDVDPTNKYKDISIDTLESELHKRHASSFFTYRGYNRIYKLFASPQFIRLEKSYRIMWTADVANCFDSIYTHTISWAVKNKKFIKKFTRFRNQFCQKFDTLLQRSNSNETNGIPVGSEVSRIFAEIIFQDIDVNIIERLQTKFNYENAKDYEILRYVDDYLIFANSEESIKQVCSVVSDCLNDYNLYLSEKKLDKYTRPFCTQKSNIITSINLIIEKFESNLFETKKLSNGKKIFVSKNINRKDRFIHVFIDRVKAKCADSNNTYSEISSYLVSVFSKRIVFLIESIKLNKKNTKDEHKESLESRKAICILMELMFFFYSVNPTVSASNKFAKTIIITDRFYKKNYPHFTAFIRTIIMDHVKQLNMSREEKYCRDGFVSLESLNILLSTSDFGTNYLIQPIYFENLLTKNTAISYFDIISLLYYFKDHTQYKHLVEEIEAIVREKLDNNFDIVQDSEIAHLFLDLLSCPYISIDFKKKYLNKFFLEHEPDFTDNTLLEDRVISLGKIYWFVKWQGADLLKILERKELKSVY